MSSGSSAIHATKIATTVGLGLVAMFLPTLPSLTLPRVKTLPSSASAPILLRDTRWRHQIAAAASVGSGVVLIGVYMQSSGVGRHPYLLYAAALSIAGASNHIFNLDTRVRRLIGSGSSEVDGVNGEQVTRELEDLEAVGWISTAFGASAFVVSLIGNIGDHY